MAAGSESKMDFNSKEALFVIVKILSFAYIEMT